jgi:hypothetical protein
MNPSPTTRPVRVPLIALLATLAALLLPAASASAGPATIAKVFGGPITTGGACSPDASATKTDAAEFTDFCVAFRAANPDGPAGVDLKSQVVDTPRGFAGVADAYPQCTDAQFAKDSEANAACPAASQMGQVAAKIRAQTSIATGIPLGEIDGNGLATLAPTGAVFNLEHSENEVARLGIDLRPSALGGSIDQPNVKIIVRVLLRPSPDVGLRSLIDDMPNTAHVKIPLLGIDERDPLAVDEFNLLFWGPKRGVMPMGFAFTGADCSNVQATSIRATAYDGSQTSGDSATYQLTDCDDPKIQFKPGISVRTSENRPDVTTETTVSVTFGESDDPNYQVAGPKKTVVVLPAGLSFSGQIASGPSGLPLCTPEQFGQTRGEPSACPAATAIGTVSFKSPSQTRLLTGSVYLGAQPAPGELPDLYIEAQLGPAADAPRVKLLGHITIDEQNRIVTALDDLPEVPVTEFLLTFRGGDQSAIVTPPTCGTTNGALIASPYNAPGAPSTVDTSYSVTDDCDAPNAFAPTLAFSGSNPNAGQFGAFTTTVTRPDRSQRLAKAVVNLPPGEVANLKGVPECTQAQAAASACPAASKVGTVSSLAGVGPAPYRANGEVFLMERPAGAVAGVSLHVPVRFGDVYLGDLNVPARIEIRDGDLGLRFVADVPERFKGIPLNIREFTVSLDRKDFSLNPTNCGPLSTTSVLSAASGATANVTAGYQVGNCGALAFEPAFDAAVTGQTGDKGRPTIQVRIENAAGSGAMRQTIVTLPKGIGVDLAQIPRACPQDTFLAGGCPDIAKIGKVAGALAIADDALTGDLYLLKPAAGKVLPGLGLSFTGRFAGRVIGSNAVDSKTGQLITQFEAVPDLPLTRLQIDIAGGTGGPVIATPELCGADQVTFAARFAAHSGQSAARTVNTSCGSTLAALGPRITGRLSGVRKGRPVVNLSGKAPTGKAITRVDLTIPKGWTLASQRGRKGSRYAKVTKLSVKRAASVKRLSSRRVRITMPKGGSSSFKLLTRSGTIAIKSTRLRKTKTKQAFTARVTAGGKVYTVPVRLTPR